VVLLLRRKFRSIFVSVSGQAGQARCVPVGRTACAVPMLYMSIMSCRGCNDNDASSSYNAMQTQTESKVV